MNTNQSCRSDETTGMPAPVARMQGRGRTDSNDKAALAAFAPLAAFAGDIRMQRVSFCHSRVHERTINRVLAARCTDLALLAYIGAPLD